MPCLPVITRRALLATLCACTLAAAVPTPKEHFGYTPGDDYKLAGYGEITGYFKKLAAESDRIRVVEYGKSSEGRALYVAFISSAENLRRLAEYQELNRRLALGLATPEEAVELSKKGKAIVWIDSGLHATEVAPAQHAPHLAYRMLTEESDEVRRIRENVILMQVPVINPDGLEMVVNWYRRNLGTAHEVAALPGLYQKYSGHDNNRDWFMLNLEETRATARLMFREWFPHIVYNQHQVAPFPARIFIPPYGEPLNPNIPAPVMEGINLIGAAMKERFARENKAGAISHYGFDAWWNGGLRSAPAFHNMHGILTETALYQFATPWEYKLSDIPERFSSGIPAREPSVFYEKPWLGGRWALMDAVNYMLTADFAILDLAASRPHHYLLKAWEMAAENIAAGRRGSPWAYVVPVDQHDAWSAREMLTRLQAAGVQIQQAKAAFTAKNKNYPAGTWIIPAGQAFRGYLMDLLEPQKYPEIRNGQNGPVQRPYDLAGWTLSYQMGVEVDRLDDLANVETAESGAIQSAEPELDQRQNSAFLAVARRLKSGQTVYRAADGTLGTSKAASGWVLKRPRVGLYSAPAGNMDAGWTEWVLDRFEIDHTLLDNAMVRAGRLRDRYDAIILPQQSMASILHGVRQGETQGRNSNAEAKDVQRPEYSGGIGLAGAAALEEFVEAGGTLVALDSATELPLSLFKIGVRGVLRAGEGEGAGGWQCPGSLLRITTDPKLPLAFGMKKDAIATSTGGQAFEITVRPEFNQGEREVRAVAWYARTNLLASGWLSGERLVAGKAAVVEAREGKGRVVLFGFRPQFRAQSFGTFKLLLNALYMAAAQPLEP